MDGLRCLAFGFFFRRHTAAGIAQSVIGCKNLLNEALQPADSGLHEAADSFQPTLGPVRQD